MATELLVRLPEDFEDQIAAGALLKGITASFLGATPYRSARDI
jgi:hypothetical protein